MSQRFALQCPQEQTGRTGSDFSDRNPNRRQFGRDIAGQLDVVAPQDRNLVGYLKSADGAGLQGAYGDKVIGTKNTRRGAASRQQCGHPFLPSAHGCWHSAQGLGSKRHTCLAKNANKSSLPGSEGVGRGGGAQKGKPAMPESQKVPGGFSTCVFGIRRDPRKDSGRGIQDHHIHLLEQRLSFRGFGNGRRNQNPVDLSVAQALKVDMGGDAAGITEQHPVARLRGDAFTSTHHA